MDKTVLAIDDERSMLAFYQAALGDLASVRTAACLSEARGQLIGVDLVLLDFNLEDDDEPIQTIVSELKTVAPVLLCTGIQDVMIPTLCAELGISGYWNKGVDHQRLRSLVRSLLIRKG